MKAYFFSTCVGAMAFSDTCVNAIKLLQNAGVEVVFKKDQACCGQPSFNSGFYEESKKIALFNMDLFNEDYPIIIPSGSCAAMMKIDYVEMFEGSEYEVRARKFSERVFELSEFLVQKLNVKYADKGKPIKITWHSNCHALRHTDSIKCAKFLLSQLANVELIELEREVECCGFGGTFSIKEPEISNAMVSAKIEDIKSRGVDCLVGADAGCLLNIDGAMRKQGVNIRLTHLYDFLASRIDL